MPNDVALKKVKDFSDEEKAAILARLKRIEPARVAKEFNTTWQVVVAIQNSTKKKAKPASRAAKKAEDKKGTKVKAAAVKRKHKSATAAADKRAAILARAEEIGVTSAAEEAGISKWTVFQWRKALKKAGMPVAPLKRKHTAAAKKTAKSKAAEPAAAAVVEAPAPKVRGKGKAKQSPAVSAPKVTTVKEASARGTNMSLEFENALLKEKVELLNAQVAKLRAAVAQLA